MNARRGRTYVVLVAFLWIFAASNAEGKRKFEDNFVDKEVSRDIQDIDEDTAEELWICCWSQLKGRTKSVEGLEFYFFEASMNNGNRKLDRDLLVKRIIQKVISDLASPEKHFIFECLKEKIAQHHELSKASGYRTLFSKWQELFSSWFTVPRRFLRGRKRHRRVISPAPAPGPLALSPNYAPMPSYLVPASSPSPILLPPSPVLQPHPKAAEPSLPVPNGIDSSPPPKIRPPPKNRSPPTVEPNPSSNEQKEKKYIITAISVGAVAGLAILSMFFLCFVKGRKSKVGPRDGQRDGIRDEKPLLNVCSSDISAGSSQNSQSIGYSSRKLSMTSSVVGNHPVIHDSSQAGTQPSEATVAAHGNTHTSLLLPPGKSATAPSGPPPPPPPKPPAPRPPPPPKMVRPPRNPPKPGNVVKPSPLEPHHRGRSSIGEGTELSGDSDAPKAKLKPFFWEKVLANPDHSMVWHDIKAGSFQFNEEMMETLFGYAPADNKSKSDNKKDSSSSQSQPQFIQIIDAKKAQNLAILLKAWNVTTEEVCDAVKEGNELPLELIQTLVKMAPSTDEELKLRLFSGDLSQLGPAERFLKIMVNIPFAFKRLEALEFMGSFQEEVSSVAEYFTTLEVACNELRNSRLFLKLLEAVLKTGNRMNDGTYRGGAHAFKLDTLLKLSDVKGTDGKTTLLHFVVQEIIRTEGLRAARRLRESQSMSSVKTEDLIDDSSQETEEYHRCLGLQVVSRLSIELENVKKAAHVDGDNLTGTVSKLGCLLLKSKEFLEVEMANVEEESEFCNVLASFLQHAETDITKLLEDEKRIMALVKSTGDYFHGNAGKDEGLRLFVVVRDFLIMVDKACKEVKSSTNRPVKTPRREALSPSPSHESRQDSLPDFRQRLFPAIKERQWEDSSSDDES